MPTATDVDNRPVAIGKWPRLRGHGHRALAGQNPNALRRHGGQSQRHADWCTLPNCVHSCDETSNICTDVLLQPELLSELYGIDRSTSANPLLEFCLDGGGLSRKCFSDTFDLKTPSENDPNETLINCLLSHCSTCSEVSDSQDDSSSRFVAKLSMHLRQNGCDINVQDSRGFTALHHLIQGKSISKITPYNIKIPDLSKNNCTSKTYELKLLTRKIPPIQPETVR